MASNETAKPKIVAVTGAAGLIGSAVARHLLEASIRVVACDNFSVGDWQREDEHLLWVRADVGEPGIGDRLGAHHPDALIHCAAHPGGLSLREPAENVRVNALGSMRLFEWFARQKKPIIYLSSSVVYGDQPSGAIPESADLRPGTVYGVCKVACENFLRILGDGFGLPWTVLRLFATYGAGHKPSLYQGVINIMLTQLLSGCSVAVKGSLERKRDFLYAEDAAAAIVKALLTPGARGHVFNIGTGQAVTIRELIETLARCLDRKASEVEIMEEKGTVGDPFSNVADITKARDMLGFAPRYDLRKGLAELIRSRVKRS
jgi:UDP-glucose 4-epimerase